MAKKIIISSSSVLLCLLLAAFLLSLPPGQSSPMDASVLPDKPKLYQDPTNYTSVDEVIGALIANGAEDADLPQTLYNLADTQWYAGNYEQARQLYKYIADNMPDNGLVFKARAWVAGSDIKLSNFEAAHEEIDALIKDYPDHPELTTIIYKLADYYWYAGRYQNAKVLYQFVFDKDPQGELAIWAKAWVAGSDIKLANIPAAQQQVETFINDFNQHPELTTLICKLADQYWYEARYQNAKDLYQIVVDRQPDSKLAAEARALLAGLELIMGNSMSSDRVLQIVTTDCAGHPNLAQIIYGVANGCWQAKKYEQAQQLYKYVADNMPNSDRGMRAKAWVAGADIMLGHYESARDQIDALIISFASDPQLPGVVYQLADAYCDVQRYQDGIRLYQRVLDKWPDAKYAPRAQFLIGNYYERLAYSGSISQSQAESEIEHAYETLIEKYPDSPDFKHAALILAELYFKKGQWPDAAGYFELLLQKYPQDRRPASILYKLARAYEEMGEFDLAEQFYGEFIESAYPTDPRIPDAKTRLEELQARAGLPRTLTDTEMAQVHGAWEQCLGDTGCTFAGSSGYPDQCNGSKFTSCRQVAKSCQTHKFGTEDCYTTSINCGGDRTRTSYLGYNQYGECTINVYPEPCPGTKIWCYE